MKKYFITFIVLILVFLGLDRIAHPKGTRFSFSKIVTTDSSPEWEIPTLSAEQQKEIDQILSQKFTNLSKGAQSYVFISEDKKYVIKFIKQKKITSQTWLSYIPLSFNPHYKLHIELQEKKRRTFHAAKLAYMEFKPETQIVYVHLNRTDNLKKMMEVVDKKGKLHTIDLDQVSFIVQKKADLIYPRITELMQKNDIEGAKKVIQSVFALVDALGKKGVVENDPIIRKNFGLIDDEAIQLDIGYMRVDPEQSFLYKDQIEPIFFKFQRWIQSHHPELSSYFEACIKEKTARAALAAGIVE